MAAVSTGCGEISMKARYPDRARVLTAWPNRTGDRRLSYQYRPSSCSPPTGSPLTAEMTGIRAGPGRTPARAAVISCSRSCTWGLWEA